MSNYGLLRTSLISTGIKRRTMSWLLANLNIRITYKTNITTLIQLAFLHTYISYNMNLLAKTTNTYNDNNSYSANLTYGTNTT